MILVIDKCQGRLRGLFWPKVVADIVKPARTPDLSGTDSVLADSF